MVQAFSFAGKQLQSQFIFQEFELFAYTRVAMCTGDRPPR